MAAAAPLARSQSAMPIAAMMSSIVALVLALVCVAQMSIVVVRGESTCDIGDARWRCTATVTKALQGEEEATYADVDQEYDLEFSQVTDDTFVQRLTPVSGFESDDELVSLCAWMPWYSEPTATCADLTSPAITEYKFTDGCSSASSNTMKALGHPPAGPLPDNLVPFAGSALCRRADDDIEAEEGSGSSGLAQEFCDVSGDFHCLEVALLGTDGQVQDEERITKTVAHLRQTPTGFITEYSQYNNEEGSAAALATDIRYKNVSDADPTICAFDRYLSAADAPVAHCANAMDASISEFHFEKGCDSYVKLLREKLVDRPVDGYYFGTPFVSLTQCVREGNSIDDNDGAPFATLEDFEPPCDVSGVYDCMYRYIFASEDGVVEKEREGELNLVNTFATAHTFVNANIPFVPDVAIVKEAYKTVPITDPRLCAYEIWDADANDSGFGAVCADMQDATLNKFHFSNDCSVLEWTAVEAVHGDDGGYFGLPAAVYGTCTRRSLE